METLGNKTRTVVLVGDYGSGKTEVSVNLALRLARVHPEVAIADLDLVNPYFRSREAVGPLLSAGIEVVVPEGAHAFADLPILVPRVKGLFQSQQKLGIVDVGGDEAGSRVLASLAQVFEPSRHALWLVVNANRPFCDTPESCLATIRRIESASKLQVTGLVSNTHLMDETTAEMVLAGVHLSEQVAVLHGAPVKFVAVMEDLAVQVKTDHPLVRMRRMMVPPWIRRPTSGLGPRLFRL